MKRRVHTEISKPHFSASTLSLYQLWAGRDRGGVWVLILLADDFIDVWWLDSDGGAGGRIRGQGISQRQHTVFIYCLLLQCCVFSCTLPLELGGTTWSREGSKGCLCMGKQVRWLIILLTNPPVGYRLQFLWTRTCANFWALGTFNFENSRSTVSSTSLVILFCLLLTSWRDPCRTINWYSLIISDSLRDGSRCGQLRVPSEHRAEN